MVSRRRFVLFFIAAATLSGARPVCADEGRGRPARDDRPRREAADPGRPEGPRRVGEGAASMMGEDAAAALVRRRSGGRVLRTVRGTDGGRVIYRVRVLHGDGRVRDYQVDAETGEIW